MTPSHQNVLQTEQRREGYLPSLSFKKEHKNPGKSGKVF
jgi:hypothetical protein